MWGGGLVLHISTDKLFIYLVSLILILPSPQVGLGEATKFIKAKYIKT